MPFSESVKLEAKKRAHFACVWCQHKELVIEVHHIVPEADRGPNEIDNASTLCPNCHSIYGHNREFRAEMRRRRDWWWERCSETSLPHFAPVLEQVNLHAERLTTLEEQQQQVEGGFQALRNWVVEVFPMAASAISSSHTVTELRQATSGLWDGSTESRVVEVPLPSALHAQGPASLLEGSVYRTHPPTPINPPSDHPS